jgi:hypothetical protein
VVWFSAVWATTAPESRPADELLGLEGSLVGLNYRLSHAETEHTVGGGAKIAALRRVLNANLHEVFEAALAYVTRTGAPTKHTAVLQRNITNPKFAALPAVYGIQFTTSAACTMPSSLNKSQFRCTRCILVSSSSITTTAAKQCSC